MITKHILLPLSLLTSAALCQQTPEGYASTTNPISLSASAVLQTSTAFAWFDGMTLNYEMGGLTQPVLQLPASVFGSFTIEAGAGQLLFGESSNGDLWLVPVNGLPPIAPLANVAFNYSAVLYDADHALVSAKTGGFSAPDNQLILVDLTNGKQQTIASLPGASGPLAMDAQGHVYYATSSGAFPPPPGSTDVLRFPRNVIDTAAQNASVLGTADAEFVIGGIDAAGALAFDDDGDLFYTDYINAIVGEIHDADGAATHGDAIVDFTGTGLSGASLHFVDGPAGLQVFEPFQPAGGKLFVAETDYFSQSQLREIAALRSTTTASVASPIPTGNFDLVTVDGPANGFGALALAPTAPAGEISLALAGFEQPLLVDVAMNNAPAVIVTFDAYGESTLPMTNPGFAPTMDMAVQVVHFSPLHGLGTSAPILLQVAQ